MRVVLRERVRDLGDPGAVVVVSDGYARNFLLPRGLAVPATEANVRSAAREAEERARRAEARAAETRDLAARLAGISVTFRLKVGATRPQDGHPGRTFGSVTAAEIAEALAEKGIEIERRRIALAEPIRSLGVHTVPVKLAGGVEASVQVKVEAA